MEYKKKELKLGLPGIVALLGAILMVATLFLPYATATEEYAAELNQFPDELVYSTMSITAEDVVNISMVEYVNVYINLSEVLFGSAILGYIYAGITILLGVFAWMVFLFALLKKAIPVIVFDVLATIVFLIQCWDYSSRGVIGTKAYDWGLAYYLFYVAAVVSLIGAIWLLSRKSAFKKQSNN